jgi:hypothetical protein
MAISRAFTRNLGAPISGTVQVGDIAYTLPGTTIDFAATGLKWYNGPDEADIVTGNGIAGDFAGYVIGIEGNTSSPDGTTSPIKFYKSNGKTEQAFIELAQTITGVSYTNGNDAAAGLSALGHASTWENTAPPVTYTQIDWYKDTNIDISACPTGVETQKLQLGSDNKIYFDTSGSLFQTELQEGIVDYFGLFSPFTGLNSGRVYTVNSGVLTATTKSCDVL